MERTESMELKNNWKLTVVSPEELGQLKNVLDAVGMMTVPATVPGCVELDLFAAGRLGDPYFAQNPYDYRFLEDKHLLYTTSFASEDDDLLHLGGVDTIADIYLNGEKIGHTENFFMEYDFPIRPRKGENLLAVHIYPPVLEARKYTIPAFCNAQAFNYETLYIRKVTSMYGWDIMPRFVSGGLYRPVTVCKQRKTRLSEIGLFTVEISPSGDTAAMRMSWSFETEDTLLCDYELRVEGVCGESRFSLQEPAWFTSGVYRFYIKQPKLWYPKRYGEPSLYRVTVSLIKQGEVLDTKELDFGIRTVELLRTSTTDADGNGEFCFQINGKRVFLLGTNWVPTDAFPCRYEERLPKALEELRDIGCNAVRVWGGGSYQSHAFYDFCDREGILVWQDFCMGCGAYPNDEVFAEKIRQEATYIVKKLRNHPSIVLWGGDNECDEMGGAGNKRFDPNNNVITRRVLAEVVRAEDLTRPYLPSSPYTDEEAYRTGKPLPEQHLWGPRDYFKGDYYKNNPCHFASEIGYHGCPSPKSLEKFLSRENLYPFMQEDGSVNEDWICHASGVVKGMKGPNAYRIPLMEKQVRTLFGESVPDCLPEFARASQISQAEAMKFFIEHFRIAKWRKTGIIWWNLLDGWPQISDAIIDWYHTKKLAYHFIKRAQEPLLLAFDEAKDGVLTLYAINDSDQELPFSFEVRNLTEGGVPLAGEAIAPAHSSIPIGAVPKEEGYRFLLITSKSQHGEKRSHFITQSRDLSYPQYLTDLKRAEMDEFEGF